MSRLHRRIWFVTSLIMGGLLCTPPIAAQVVPDDTLPQGERSQISGNPNFQIDGGARRGGNLFHSFSQFSVPTGGSAYFNNAADVQNIFSRVTGRSISNIDGVIRANGTANLFLLNPNGIIFGPNASLNIGGSLVASTASSIQFADGTEFSAINPSASPLLTISVPIGLQFNGQQGDIVMQGTPENPVTEIGDAGQLLDTAQPIDAADGTRFNAIAGNLNYDNDVDLYQLYLRQGVPFQASTVSGTNVDTQLFLFDSRGVGLLTNDDSSNTLQSALPLDAPIIPAVSGTYYLGISSQFNAPLSSEGRIFSQLEEPNGPGAGLPLSSWNTSRVNDRGPYVITLVPQSYFQVQPGRTIALVGGNVTLERSNLQALGGRVELGGIANSGTVGLNVNGDRINLSFPNPVTRADVTLRNSGIDVRRANGSMSIVARNIDITRSLLRGGIPNNLRLPDAQTGDLDLNATGSITFGDSSNLVAALEGEGAIGNINLTAGERISIDNATVDLRVVPEGVGNAGDINITTGSLFLRNSGRVVAFTFGRGDVGSLNINARDTVSVEGRNIGGFPSRLSNSVFSESIGNSGGINITTGLFSVTNGARVNSTTVGQEDAGDITINARDTVLFRNSAGLPDSRTQLETSTFGDGNGGNINITTGSLFIANGARMFSNTRGSGNAGNVTINARDVVSLDGENPNGRGNENLLFTLNSTIYTQVNSGSVGPPGSELRFRGTGRGGDVTITTGSLFLTNGGAVNTATQGQGNAGRVTIVARDTVQIRGTAPTRPDEPSGVVTSATLGSVGNGGDVIIRTGSLAVSDRGRINTNTQGQGNAGNIRIRANDTALFDDGDAISTVEQSAVGRGGNINVEARSLSVLNHAQLIASTTGNGNAGNITISTDRVSLNGGGQLVTTTLRNGQAGNITLNTPLLQLSGRTSGLFAGTTSTGNAGNLTIQSRGNGQAVRVELSAGAQISASTASSGRGGRLTITAPDSITLTGNGSVISAETSGRGVGGNLTLQTATLNIQNQAQVTVSSSGRGSAGSLFVDADRIFLDNGGRIRADTSGGGGNVSLRSPLIVLRNGSNITTNATGRNIPGGNIGIDTRFLVAVPNEDSNISANSEDFRGGNVSIEAIALYGIQPSSTSTPLSDITATGATSALPGTVDVTTATVDPTVGLLALPTDVADASQLIAQECPANEDNSFVITGRGGLPPTPEQQLDDDARWSDRRRLVVPSPNYERDNNHQPLNDQSQRLQDNNRISNSEITEATQWLMSSSGEVVLVANTPHSTVQRMSNGAIACSNRR
ncbi:filamentous hemagglutinin N-terminal domain-containing protein [Oscillatoria sp. FACHB-1407]|uniref:two-partner secretion domain-containing protein n=1 Tax=Oscillatoria sp. FACHB-1407 TaxID=2692847 RepID=UPI00168578DD|nr:filamentous hemagglutinin N-terminal domain-containing protein [Oscillatoria sp. FACHB-1407]MBD2463440.1 filamentous hemagglutinin N-terminal domain-containing protein [Oscillatoria sp. FACHB-1407]